MARKTARNKKPFWAVQVSARSFEIVKCYYNGRGVYRPFSKRDKRVFQHAWAELEYAEEFGLRRQQELQSKL